MTPSDSQTAGLLLRCRCVGRGELAGYELGVESALCQQARVRAGLDQTAFLQHHDHVGIADGGETVSNHHGGTLRLQVVEGAAQRRSEEHTSELQSLMRISYAVFCLKKKKPQYKHHNPLYSNKRHEKSDVYHTHNT